MPDKDKGKPRVIKGKIFALAELHRRLDAMGYPISQNWLSEVFSPLPEKRGEPSLKLFRAMAAALGLTLDEMYELLEKVRNNECTRLRY